MSTPAVEDDRDLPLDPDDLAEAVDELLCMNDREFDDVVSEDVVCTLDDDFLRAALRDDKVLDRWFGALTALIVKIEGQMAANKGQRDSEARSWRGAARRVQGGAIARRNECRLLRADRNRRLHPPKLERNQALGTFAPKRRIAIPGREGVENTKEARAAAGERAIKRLQDAHPEEFMDLLAQEYGKAGLPVRAHWIRGIDG